MLAAMRRAGCGHDVWDLDRPALLTAVGRVTENRRAERAIPP